MNCHEVKKKLPDFLDSQLSEEQSTQIHHHLESCMPCTQEVKRLQTTWEVLGQWPEVNPSPHFKQRFWEKISELEKQKAPKGWLSWGWRTAWIPLGSLAAALFLILLWVLWPSAQKDDDVQMATVNQQNSLLELAASLDLLEHKDLLLEMELLEDFDLLLALDEGSEG
jgi:anti-sigma factor RsiW